jgi:geranylgeranyl diphosphate synthase type II
MTPSERFKFYTDVINEYVECLIPGYECHQKELYDSMYYSLSAGGKRIRPMLCIEFCRVCNGDINASLPFAAALEMIHTYSLIHDDLPCMDNDDLRRGKPTNHKVFGEATALLAGDALFTYAVEYALKSADKIDAKKVLNALDVLVKAAGPNGMVGGQIVDLKSEKLKIPIDKLDALHKMKTGALITASVKIGCILAGADENILNAAIDYSQKIGLAFQIKDDILDVEGDVKKLGKNTGGDEQSKKSTYVTHFGLNGAKKKLSELTAEAKKSISSIEDNEFLNREN